MEEQTKKLADLIEAYPTCEFHIDNDNWQVTIQRDGEEELTTIARSDDYSDQTNWYSYGNTYGSALADAMVELLNRRGFKIEASAV